MSVLKRLAEAIRWVAFGVFWLGLGIGVYVRAIYLPDSGWIIIAACIAFISMAASVLLTLRGSNSYWMESLTKMTTSFNSSFLLGLVAFSQTEPMREDYLELAMNLVLLASLVLYLTGVATVGSMVTPAAPVVMESHELFGLAGLSSAILMAASQHVFGLICSVAFLGIVIFSFHRKNLVIILAIPLYVILNMKVILGGADLINRESLAVLSLTLICQPLVNIFTSSVSTLDAWKPVLGTRSCMVRLATILVMLLEILLAVLTGLTLRDHKEWYAVLPLFCVCLVLLWMPAHLVYFLVNWKLWSRVKKAMEIFNSDRSRSLSYIMTSRGLRHFALVTYPLVWTNAVLTLVQFVWSWTTQTDITSGLLLVCLPIQMVLIGFLRDLSNGIGGTCCGCALVTPAVLPSADGVNTREVQASSSYATRSVGLIQGFFNHHLIDDGGCEYLSERLTEVALCSKLNGFFMRRTKEGECYDSYVLYYSGPVTADGHWVLKGDALLSYAQLISLWTKHDVCKSSRLILVLDTAKSNYWVSHVRRTTVAYVGIQTLYVRREAEDIKEFSIGEFTRDWVDFNCNKDSEIYSDGFTSPIVSTFGVSRYWSSFKFQEPSVDDMDRHWKENFSLRMKPLIRLYSLFDRKNFCCICISLGKCLSMVRLWLWTPNMLHTGHGFKMVRFFKVPNSTSIF